MAATHLGMQTCSRSVDLLEFSYTTISVSSLGENALLKLEVSGEWSAVTPFHSFHLISELLGHVHPAGKNSNVVFCHPAIWHQIVSTRLLMLPYRQNHTSPCFSTANMVVGGGSFKL